MNDLVPTPNNIAENLLSIEAMVESGTVEEMKIAKRMLRNAAANVRLLFELSADPESGEFRLQNYGQAWMLADLLTNAKLVPSSFDTPEQVVVALMKATEIRVSPITGLANIMIVNNRPSVWGDLAQALVERSGQIAGQKKERIGPEPAPGLELADWNDMTGWRVSTSRKGQSEPYVGEYTVAHARRAGLWMNVKRKPWISDPDQMLFNRGRARSLKDGFADCLLGMSIIEEQSDFETITLKPEAAKQVTQSALDDEPDTVPQQLTDYSDRGEPTPEPEVPPADLMSKEF